MADINLNTPELNKYTEAVEFNANYIKENNLTRYKSISYTLYKIVC